MITNSYSFHTAQPFYEFIEKNKKQIYGQKLCKFYVGDGVFGGFSVGPAVFELERFTVVVKYCFYSDIVISIADKTLIRNSIDAQLPIADRSGGEISLEGVFEEDFPYAGCRIKSIDLKRFSSTFEINPSSGETKPEDGDYFSTITVNLEDGKRFFICAADPICDGGIEVWD